MSRDLKEYEKQTNRRLIIGAVVLLLVVGVGLIWLIYGGGAASMGFFCLMVGLVPVVLIVGIFYAADWIMKNAGRK
ncbi:MAG: hypothetical protein IPO36_02055 [Anaerolineales bacterium]|jgi:high-affinity Fe2+/Pb2+ permease|uniref:hypothetical protein n=1 Tax=Candidatus Villigracilis affinis TaxID=3140682 RepID=UPI001D874420|nr:hypothetical protein [Anaerolineales bacterium]MBK9600616.1 hypothetical protein [Anaerolineales bacterium]MBL0345544.1 hypothetical protein [Anaerolineales bacterium]